MLVNMISEDDIADLTEKFKAIDTDGSGMIEISELAEILEKKKISIEKV